MRRSKRTKLSETVTYISPAADDPKAREAVVAILVEMLERPAVGPGPDKPVKDPRRGGGR